MLKRGADVNGKTSNGFTSLHLAASRFNEDMAELLLKNHALVNERTDDGRTAMHIALRSLESSDIAHMLLDYDVDLNILTNSGITPLAHAPNFFIGTLIKHLARFSIKFNQPVCDENIEFLRGQNKLKKLEDCLDELRRMKNRIVYNGISLYDIFTMSEKSKKLTFLTMNKDFLASFWSAWNRNLFKNYREILDGIFKRAVERRDFLQAEEKKLRSIFKDILPELIIRKVAFFNNAQLFIES